MSKIFIYHKNRFELKDKEIALSPYLTTISTTSIHVPKDEEGNIILHLDVSPSTFQNYINFLRGRAFDLSDTNMDFFDYMGHDNYYEYPADYWKSVLEDGRHNVCGNMVDKVDTVTAVYQLQPLDTLFHGIDLYYVGDTALLSAGIINKVSSLPIIYNLKDRTKIMNALGKMDSKSNIFQGEVQLGYKSLNVSIKPYKILKPLLELDNMSRRAKFPDKIWNNKNTQYTLYGMDFDCMEKLLYLFPADTDGIVMHVNSGIVHKSLTLLKSHKAYMTKEVNLIPEFIHHEQYIQRLCELSLMGFKINAPKYLDIVSYDEYKMNRLLERVGNERMNDVEYPIKITYLMNPPKAMEVRLTKEDYIALLSMGPCRPEYKTVDILGKYYKKEVDINELYSMSQLVEDMDMVEYQYSKHVLDIDKPYDGTYYRIGRIDTYDIDGQGYIVGPSILEALKFDSGIIPHKFHKELPDVSLEVLDQCYCNVKDGIVYASLPLINVLYNKEHTSSKYDKSIVNRVL